MVKKVPNWVNGKECDAFQNKTFKKLNPANGKILFTPHSAFYSPTGLTFLREKALKTCIDHLQGIKIANCVNIKYLKNQRSL